MQDLRVDQFVAGPVVGVPELLGHVRNVVVVVDNVGLVSVLLPPVLRPGDPTVHTIHLLLLLLVRVLLYLGHRVDPPVVERFEVSPAGQGSRVEMHVSLLSCLTPSRHPGRQSVVRVLAGPGLGEARVRGVGVVGLGGEVGGHVGWEGVAVAHKLLLVLRLRLAVSRPGVAQVAGAGS